VRVPLNTKGRIFDAQRIPATRMSNAKRLTKGSIKIIFFQNNQNIFLKLRHVSLRRDKFQNFYL
jgi:hypothetical protein